MKLSFQVLEGGSEAGEIKMKDLTTVLLKVYPEMGLQKIEDIVIEADANLDGTISLDEFLQMAQNHPELSLTGRSFWSKLF